MKLMKGCKTILVGMIVLLGVSGGQATAEDVVKLQSYNYTDHDVRHRNFSGEITTVTSQLDVDDSTFRMVSVHGVEGPAESVERIGEAPPPPASVTPPAPPPLKTSVSSPNAAIHKKATQSSTGYGGVPERAIDGNNDGNYGSNSITHTNSEPGAWWQVDLGESNFIQSIRVWNRTDCCGDRLSNFYVLVSDSPFPSTPLTLPPGESGVWYFYHSGVAARQTDIPVSVSGRYVRVQLAGTNYLSLAEVEVFTASDGGDKHSGKMISKEVISSTVDQTHSFGKGLSITIPAGALASSDTLTVGSSTRKLPLGIDTDIAVLGTHEISLASGKVPPGKLKLEFGYEEMKLDPEMPEEVGFGVSFYDTTTKTWRAVPCSVDTGRKKVIVETSHLSTWAFWRINGYEYVVSAERNFNVYYRSKNRAPVLDTVNGYTMKKLAEDVADYMEQAYKWYADAGFKVPTTYVTRINVVLARVEFDEVLGTIAGTDANWGGITGWIYMPVHELKNSDQVRHDTAHELFHYVQNQYINVYKMGALCWWIEGTPDYIASKVWNQPSPMPHFDEDPYRFTTTFYPRDSKTDAYYMSRFVEWLVKKHGADFKKMWDFVISNSSVSAETVRFSFEKYVTERTGKTFDMSFADYVAYIHFDSESPFSDEGLQKTAAGNKARVIGIEKDGKEILEHRQTHTMQADLTAPIWRITSISPKNGKARTIEIFADGVPDGCSLEIWRLVGNKRGKNNASLLGVLVGSQTKKDGINLNDEDALYVVMLNSGKSVQTVTLTARTSSEDAVSGATDDWYGLKIKYAFMGVQPTAKVDNLTLGDARQIRKIRGKKKDEEACVSGELLITGTEITRYDITPGDGTRVNENVPPPEPGKPAKPLSASVPFSYCKKVGAGISFNIMGQVYVKGDSSSKTAVVAADFE